MHNYHRTTLSDINTCIHFRLKLDSGYCFFASACALQLCASNWGVICSRRNLISLYLLGPLRRSQEAVLGQCKSSVNCYHSSAGRMRTWCECDLAWPLRQRNDPAWPRLWGKESVEGDGKVPCHYSYRAHLPLNLNQTPGQLSPVKEFTIIVSSLEKFNYTKEMLQQYCSLELLSTMVVFFSHRESRQAAYGSAEQPHP